MFLFLLGLLWVCGVSWLVQERFVQKILIKAEMLFKRQITFSQIHLTIISMFQLLIIYYSIRSDLMPPMMFLMFRNSMERKFSLKSSLNCTFKHGKRWNGTSYGSLFWVLIAAPNFINLQNIDFTMQVNTLNTAKTSQNGKHGKMGKSLAKSRGTATWLPGCYFWKPAKPLQNMPTFRRLFTTLTDFGRKHGFSRSKNKIKYFLNQKSSQLGLG